MAVDSHVRKQPPRLKPPGSRTGIAQEGCYLRDDCNCSKGLTGEHYVSKTVLQGLGDQIKIMGMPWLSSGEERTVGINSLTANLLCERHNNVLSPLDDEAGKFCSCLDGLHRNLSTRSLSRRSKAHLFSGEALELWMLKVTCGVCLSFASINGTKVKTDHIFDLDKVTRAFNEYAWEPSAGLYLKSTLGTTIVGSRRVSIAPLTSTIERRIVGARLWLYGLEFDLLFDVTGMTLPQASEYKYRPSAIDFRNERRREVVVLTWPREIPYQDARFTARGRA